jgi:NAD(P)H-dependent FMN reductase
VAVVVTRDKADMGTMLDTYGAAAVLSDSSRRVVAGGGLSVRLDDTTSWQVRLPGGAVLRTGEGGKPFGSALGRAVNTAAGQVSTVAAFSAELTAWLKADGDWARSRAVFTGSRGGVGGSSTAAHNRQAVLAAARRVPDDEAIQFGTAILEATDAQVEKGTTFDAFNYLEGVGDRVDMLLHAVPQGAMPLSTLATLAKNVPGQGVSVSVVEAIDMIKQGRIQDVRDHLMSHRPDLSEQEKLEWVHRILALQPAMPELEHQLTELAELVLTCW